MADFNRGWSGVGWDAQFNSQIYNEYRLKGKKIDNLILKLLIFIKKKINKKKQSYI